MATYFVQTRLNVQSLGTKQEKLSWIRKDVAKGLRDRRCKRVIELLSSRLLDSEQDEDLEGENQALFIFLLQGLLCLFLTPRHP